MSNFVLKNIVPAKRSEKVMYTMQLKNIKRCFMGRWVNDLMGQPIKNSYAQQDSEISISKPSLTGLPAVGPVPQSGDLSSPLDLKDVHAQRYSKISNLEYLLLLSSVPRGQKTGWRLLSNPDVFHINLFQRVEKYKFSVKFYLDILIQKLIFIKIRQ